MSGAGAIIGTGSVICAGAVVQLYTAGHIKEPIEIFGNIRCIQTSADL